MLAYGDPNINASTIIVSLAVAVGHFLIEGILLGFESIATRTSMFYYTVICLNGRLNWVPFTEKFTREARVVEQ